MKQMIKTACALCLALCMLTTGALAELSWLDDALSSYLDINDDTTFSLGFQINELLPFSEETVGMINGVLGHLRMNSRVQDTSSLMALLVDGENMLSFSENEADGRMAFTTSLLPNRTLVADGSPMDVLSGNETLREEPFDLFRAIEGAEECYMDLADAIVPFATEKSANYKISGIGYARWVRLAKLTAEDSQALMPQIIALLSCGMDQAFREQLQGMTCGDNFTIALYSTAENGEPLAMYMKGSVTMADGEKWQLAYQWAFLRDEEGQEDTYRYELTQNKSPRHKRIIEASRELGGQTGTLEIIRKADIQLKDADRNETIVIKDSIEAVEKGNKTTLTGSLVTTVKDQSSENVVSHVTTFTPDLLLTSAEGTGVLSGSVSLKETQGKTVLRDLVFIFDEEPAQLLDVAAEDGSLYAVAEEDPLDPAIAGSSLAQNIDVDWGGDTSLQDYLVGNPPIGLTAHPTTKKPVTVDLDQADESVVAALRDEMAQNMAGVLLIALGRLPQEELSLLSDNMTETDYAIFMQLLGDL
ncbi:MAG: hypothetical protein E7319_08545 [Clostridiales bacterium]|nr:hypothetical protein [Clostridiales bacterium]